MINCGGLGNITQCFTLTEMTKVYIIDSHRPLNLENMHNSNTQVCVFDDESETAKISEVMDAFDAIMVNLYYADRYSSRYSQCIIFILV
jgi:cell division control protein 45